MRIAEWINLIFFLLLTGLAWIRPLTLVRRGKIALLGGIGVGWTLASWRSDLFLAPSWSTFVRDWSPAPIVLIAYWQAGGFFVEPWEAFQERLRRMDSVVGRALGVFKGLSSSRWFRVYLEAAYLLAYPLVPFALVVLYLGGRAGQADLFWAVVLPPSYVCYAMLPFIQTLPPRLLHTNGVDFVQGTERGVHRLLNLWILRYLGIGANTFPSGHVAATMAASLVVYQFLPTVGMVFLWVALSIAVSVVVRRYHYFVDAVLGGALALGGWFLGNALRM